MARDRFDTIENDLSTLSRQIVFARRWSIHRAVDT